MADTQTEAKKPAPDHPSERPPHPPEAEHAPLSAHPEVDLSSRANQITSGRTPGADARPAASVVQGDHLVIPPAFDAKPPARAGAETPQARAAAETPQPAATQPGMTPDTLSSAAQALKANMNDKTASEAILRSIPAQDKQRFEQIYGDQNRGSDLRTELKAHGYDTSLLEPREETRNAAWLQKNLDQLSHFDNIPSTVRSLVEQNVRTSLMSMSEHDRTALSQELKTSTGHDLQETLSSSHLSSESKQIAAIYAANGTNLSVEQRRQVADIGLKADTSDEQKLMIVKEAFSGTTDEARKAREQFMGANGEGEQRLKQAFDDPMDQRQALDYAHSGRLDTSTLIDLQASKWANNDKGIEIALNMMTPEQRAQYQSGARAVNEGRTQGHDQAETEAIKYYQGVSDSLHHASLVLTDTHRWSAQDRALQEAAWDDMASHGHLTLQGKMAQALQRSDVNGAVDLIRHATPEDHQLMQDKTYRDSVTKLADQNGTVNMLGHLNNVLRPELKATFGDNGQAAPTDRAHTLAQVANDWQQRASVSMPNLYDALRTGTADEYKQLNASQRAVIDNMTAGLDPRVRESGTAMLQQLKQGKDVHSGLPEQIMEDAVSGASRLTIMQHLQAAGGHPTPEVEAAAKSVLGRDYESLGKPILDGKPMTAEMLHDATYTPGHLWGGTLDHQAYYDNLKNLPQAERDRVTQLAAAAGTDANAKQQLDRVFQGMSNDEREIALSVLKNPNQEFTLADKIRAHSIGANIDQQQLVSDFTKMSPQQRLDQINDYATKYHKFLPDELSRGADQATQHQIDLALPMSRGDLDRAFKDWSKDSGTGLYGHAASTEVSLAETQNKFQSELIDKMPPEQRAQAQQNIDQAFQKYVQALKDNSDAKDKYAKDLSESIMMAATTVVGAGPVGTTMARLALTTATAVAARMGTEHLIKGDTTQSDATAAMALGVMDGASLGRMSALKGLFTRSVEGAVGSAIGTEATHSAMQALTPHFEQYAKGELTEQELRQQMQKELAAKGVQQPEQATDDIMRRYKAEEGDAVKAGEHVPPREMPPAKLMTPAELHAASEQIASRFADRPVTPDQFHQLFDGQYTINGVSRPLTDDEKKLVGTIMEQSQGNLTNEGLNNYMSTLRSAAEHIPGWEWRTVAPMGVEYPRATLFVLDGSTEGNALSHLFEKNNPGMKARVVQLDQATTQRLGEVANQIQGSEKQVQALTNRYGENLDQVVNQRTGQTARQLIEAQQANAARMRKEYGLDNAIFLDDPARATPEQARILGSTQRLLVAGQGFSRGPNIYDMATAGVTGDTTALREKLGGIMQQAEALEHQGVSRDEAVRRALQGDTQQMPNAHLAPTDTAAARPVEGQTERQREDALYARLTAPPVTPEQVQNFLGRLSAEQQAVGARVLEDGLQVNSYRDMIDQARRLQSSVLQSVPGHDPKNMLIVTGLEDSGSSYMVNHLYSRINGLTKDNFVSIADLQALARANPDKLPPHLQELRHALETKRLVYLDDYAISGQQIPGLIERRAEPGQIFDNVNSRFHRPDGSPLIDGITVGTLGRYEGPGMPNPWTDATRFPHLFPGNGPHIPVTVADSPARYSPVMEAPYLRNNAGDLPVLADWLSGRSMYRDSPIQSALALPYGGPNNNAMWVQAFLESRSGLRLPQRFPNTDWSDIIAGRRDVYRTPRPAESE